MKIRVIELEAGEIPTFYDFDSYREAKEYMDKIVANAKKKKHKVRQDPEYKDGYYIDSNYIYIEEPKSKPFEWDFNQEKTTPTKRSLSNSNTNQKQITTMPKASKSFKAVPYDPTKRDANGRVIGNPYQLTSNGTRYQAVPERMVTLPKGNAFIIAKKHVQLDERNQATYVLGYSNLSGKRQNGKTRRHYFVARLIYRGGNPALALYRYSGYDLGTAKTVFHEIAYNSAEYLGKDKKFHSYSKKSMTSADIVKSKIKQQDALEKMKTAAYGSKADRVAYAQKNRKKYPRVAKK